RLTVPDAAKKKRRPFGYDRQRILHFGQKASERRMVPAQLVFGAVTVSADAVSEPAQFLDELFARQPFEVLVHIRLSSTPAEHGRRRQPAGTRLRLPTS